MEKGQLEAYKQELEAKVCERDVGQLLKGDRFRELALSVRVA